MEIKLITTNVNASGGGVGFKFIGKVDAVSRKPILFGTTSDPNQPAKFEINGKAFEVTSNDESYFELFWDNGVITSMHQNDTANYPVLTLDASNLNTSQITDMSMMFNFCEYLTSLNLSNWKTSQVTDMSAMFFNCKSLISLDLSNFDTSQVTNMESMFYNGWSLASLDLSNFDTSQVTNMNSMFMGCSPLRTIKINDEASANKLIAQIKLDIEKDARWDSTTKLITIPK